MSECYPQHRSIIKRSRLRAPCALVIGFLVISCRFLSPQRSRANRRNQRKAGIGIESRKRVPADSPFPISDFPPAREIEPERRAADHSRGRGRERTMAGRRKVGSTIERRSRRNFPDSPAIGSSGTRNPRGGAKGMIPRARRASHPRRIGRARGEKAEVAPAARWASRIDLPLQ